MQNTRRGKGKYILLVITLLAVVGLTLGFAAFSNTLTIKSSATVTPDASTFKVVFSSNPEELETNEIEPELLNDLWHSVSDFTATNAVINNTGNPTISGLNANFIEPGRIVLYLFYIRNEGEYDAYLNEIIFNNVEGKSSNVVCTADKDEQGNPLATQSLVDEACNGISISFRYDYEDGDMNFDHGEILTDEYKLEKGAGISAAVQLSYEGTKRADGPFTVSIGDIELVWSTIMSGE